LIPVRESISPTRPLALIDSQHLGAQGHCFQTTRKVATCVQHGTPRTFHQRPGCSDTMSFKALCGTFCSRYPPEYGVNKTCVVCRVDRRSSQGQKVAARQPESLRYNKETLPDKSPLCEDKHVAWLIHNWRGERGAAPMRGPRRQGRETGRNCSGCIPPARIAHTDYLRVLVYLVLYDSG